MPLNNYLCGLILIHSLLFCLLNLSSATAENQLYPQINDDREFNDYQVNHNEEAAMVETAEALLELHNAPLVFKNNSCTALVAWQEPGGDGAAHRADKEDVAEWFTKEELEAFLYVEKVEDDLVEVICGCSTMNRGDYSGKLRVFKDGRLLVDCECAPSCDIVDATPGQFVSHAGAKRGPGEWPRMIWVHEREGPRISIERTPFMRYFRLAGMKVEKRQRGKFHKDEFLKCSACGKERRFKLTSLVRCRAYHDAMLMEKTWTCAMHPFIKMDCDTEAERATRMLARGCPAKGTCRGCPLCTCTGCLMCRYPDCGCQECENYIRNSGSVDMSGRYHRA